MSSNIKITRKCHFCGEKFIAKTTVTQNCSDRCAKKAYKQKLKERKIKESELETGAMFHSIKSNLHEKVYLSIKEASTLYGVSEKTVRRMISMEKLPFIRFNRRIIILNKEIKDLLTQNKTKGFSDTIMSD